MKNRVKILILSVFTFSLAFLASCGNDKEVKPANRITVNGTGYDFSNAYYFRGSQRDFDGTPGYRYEVFLTGKGLAIKNGNFDGDGNFVRISLLSKDAELQDGIYTLDISHSDLGSIDIFALATSYKGNSYDEVFLSTSGYIKVSRSENIYTFTMEFDKYQKGETPSSPAGEGTITGYYSGTLEPFVASSGARKPNQVFNPFTF